jgi:CheY-like chemotaxis protein
MMDELQWHDMVSSAYRSLYDFIALRQHPLNDYLLQGQIIDPKERGWKIHNLLLKFIDELNPKGSSPLSKEWRRHRLLVLRYIETMPPDQIATQLAISRRQFYREHHLAIAALVMLIQAQSTVPESIPPPEATNALHQELTRMEQHESSADFTETIHGILSVLDKILTASDIDVQVTIPPNIPLLSIGQNILRQVLMGIMGMFVGHYTKGRLSVDVVAHAQIVTIHLQTDPSANIPEAILMQNNLQAISEMIHFAKGELQLLRHNGAGVDGLSLTLPITESYTVLVADDNEDTLALYQRFLSHKQYHVVVTSDATATLSLALKNKPDFIILDLMMPDRDGWDLLQALSNQPETQAIPVIICSVLKQQQLANSLGAAAFLEKPFTEQSLLATLAQVRGYKG